MADIKDRLSEALSALKKKHADELLELKARQNKQLDNIEVALKLKMEIESMEAALASKQKEFSSLQGIAQELFGLAKPAALQTSAQPPVAKPAPAAPTSPATSPTLSSASPQLDSQTTTTPTAPTSAALAAPQEKEKKKSNPKKKTTPAEPVAAPQILTPATALPPKKKPVPAVSESPSPTLSAAASPSLPRETQTPAWASSPLPAKDVATPAKDAAIKAAAPATAPEPAAAVESPSKKTKLTPAPAESSSKAREIEAAKAKLRSLTEEREELDKDMTETAELLKGAEAALQERTKLANPKLPASEIEVKRQRTLVFHYRSRKNTTYDKILQNSHDMDTWETKLQELLKH